MTKIELGDMSIDDVPFTKKDLDRFLDEINNAQGSIKALPRPKKAQRKGRSRSGSRSRSRSRSGSRSVVVS
jgi:hypothetical protein